MAKRKAAEVEQDAPVTTNRRSARHKTSKTELLAPGRTEKPQSKPTEARKAPIKHNKTEIGGGDLKENETAITGSKGDAKASEEQQYWLMKAEPESRFEKGHDVKFSIDDLASKTEPEPWDGIRSYAARNNLRAMKKGDLAFFYHSSCKVPAIVGIMEIVQEHSPDLTAQDPGAAYYDPKDKDPSDPKWSVVHVEFRKKFKTPITLHELKGLQASNKELADVQMLKQSRLSVSKVTKSEWDFLKSIIDVREAQGDSE